MMNKNVICGTVDFGNISIDVREVSAKLGYDAQLSDLSTYFDALKKSASCRYAYIKTPLNISGSECDLGFCKVKSNALSTVLKECDGAYIFAVTLGLEVDRLISKSYVKSQADGFIIDALSSAAVEGLADHVDAIISKGKRTVKRFSPGYADLPLEFQTSLLSALNGVNTVGISLSESLMMIPRKSITAVIGVKRGNDE